MVSGANQAHTGNPTSGEYAPMNRKFPLTAWKRVFFILFVLPIFFVYACMEKNPSEKTTVRFLTWKPNQPEVWEEIYHIFEKEYPNISLLRETGPQSSTAFHDLLTQKLKNKSQDVDVFFMDVVWPPEFASAGWAEALDGYFPEEDRQKFLKAPILANTYGGHIWGIPLFIDSGVLFYRKDLLNRYGFNPPERWEHLVDQAERIMSEESDRGFALTGYSGQFKQYEGLVCNMMEFILSHGGHIIDPGTGNAALDRAPAVDAVTFVRDNVIGRVGNRGMLTYQESESLDVFTQGRAVFHRNWPYAWQICNDPSRSTIAGKVGIAKMPHFKGGESHSTLGGWQLGISAYSKDKEAAWQFVKFLTSSRIQKLLAVKSGKAPTRKALYADPEIIEKNPHFDSLKEVFLTAYPRPRSPLYPSISNVLQRYFSSALSSYDSPVQQEASEATKQIDHFIALTK